MTQEQVMISNKLGLHARAAAKLVHTASAFEAEIYVGTEHEEGNAKASRGFRTLAATKGTPLNVRVSERPAKRQPQDLVLAVDAVDAVDHFQVERGPLAEPVGGAERPDVVPQVAVRHRVQVAVDPGQRAEHGQLLRQRISSLDPDAV